MNFYELKMNIALTKLCFVLMKRGFGKKQALKAKTKKGKTENGTL